VTRLFCFWLCCALVALADPVPLEVLERFSAEVEAERARWRIPAVAVGYVQDGKLAWFQGYGQKSRSDPRPPDPDTVFNIGSASKAFGATTLAIAVDQGKLDWDDRLVDRDPEFAMADPWVTREFRLFDLFAQHPGVSAYALSIPLSLGYPPDHLMKAWRHVPASGHFRSTFAYVNIPHLFAGRLLARLYGQPDWEAVVASLVLRPLGMTRTTGYPEVLSWPNRAPGHVLVDGQVRQTESGVFPFNAGPAGSLSSTVNDLTRWVAFQCGEGSPLLSSQNLMRTRWPQTQVDPSTAYAMGWGVAYRDPTPLVWHTGGTLTHACIVAFEPETRQGLIVLTNLGGQNLAQPLAYRFFDLLHGADRPNPLEAAWASRQAQASPATTVAQPVAAQQDLLGSYSSPALGRLTIAEGLIVRLDPINLKGRLEPVTGDVFRLVPSDPLWTGLGLDELFFLHFQRDLEGRVIGARALQEGGSGLDSTLTREPESQAGQP
jgi:CubicO group peptidase (beta-lactamase class C family)